jgi:transposase
MTTEEQIAFLSTQLNQALEQLKQTQEQLQQTQEQLRQAQGRIAELEKQKTPPPAFINANVKKPKNEEKKPRKNRDAKHNQARKRSVPTQVVEHRLVYCPNCHLRLGGIGLARSREVIDVPEPQPVEITQHRICKGWCAGCQKWHEAPLDLHDQVVGQGRVGVRLASLIATLRTLMRLPIRHIQSYLLTLHSVAISTGEIVELLHRLKEHMQPHLDALKVEIRASPAIQADERGCREDGINGYIWALSTPSIRYYEYHHSRAAAGRWSKSSSVRTLKACWEATSMPLTIFIKGCINAALVHFLRDVHNLKELHPDDEQLLTWARLVKAIYDEAVAWVEQSLDQSASARQQPLARVAKQHAFEQRLWQVCAAYVHTSTPMQTLCKRVEMFLPELFVFVVVPGVPSHNNLAQRSVRPLVVARKISGGTRSPKGSQTRMGLASLFGTWIAQNLNPFHQCLAALTTKSSLGQV